MSEIKHENIDINLRNMTVETLNPELSKEELIEIVHQLICIVHSLQKSFLNRTDGLDDRVDCLESGCVRLDEKIGQLGFDLAELRGGL